MNKRILATLLASTVGLPLGCDGGKKPSGSSPAERIQTGAGNGSSDGLDSAADQSLETGSLGLTTRQATKLAQYLSASDDVVEVRALVDSLGLSGQDALPAKIYEDPAVQYRWMEKVYSAFDMELSNEAWLAWRDLFAAEGFDPFMATYLFLANISVSEQQDLKSVLTMMLDQMKRLSPTGELAAEVSPDLEDAPLLTHVWYLATGFQILVETVELPNYLALSAAASGERQGSLALTNLQLLQFNSDEPNPSPNYESYSPSPQSGSNATSWSPPSLGGILDLATQLGRRIAQSAQNPQAEGTGYGNAFTPSNGTEPKGDDANGDSGRSLIGRIAPAAAGFITGIVAPGFPGLGGAIGRFLPGAIGWMVNGIVAPGGGGTFPNGRVAGGGGTSSSSGGSTTSSGMVNGIMALTPY